MNNNSLHNKNNVLHQDEFFDHFAKFIRDSTNGKRLQKNGMRIKSSTIDNYICVYKLLKCFSHEFELKLIVISKSKKKELNFIKKYWICFYNKFKAFLYRNNYFDNYVGLIIKTLRIFFNYLKDELQLEIGYFYKRFYIPKEDIPIVVLSPDELRCLIIENDITSKLTEDLIQVKDFFVFGCTVALRVSDLMQLKQHHCVTINNKHYLEVYSKKTNTPTSIHLPEYAVKIIDKYKNKTGYLLPQYSIGYLNIKLKELGRHIFSDKPFIKLRMQNGKQTIIYKNKATKTHYTLADHITTHTMRRTAITTMLTLGMPEPLVRKISGHAANSKEFYKYVHYSQKIQDTETEKMFDRLLKKN